MNPTEIIDGEVFLSSREAGKISKYTHDYIARLCREGKLCGKKINRTWYVREDSLTSFLNLHEEEKELKYNELSEYRKLSHKGPANEAHPKFLFFGGMSLAAALSAFLLIINLYQSSFLTDKHTLSETFTSTANISSVATYPEHIARAVFNSTNAFLDTFLSLFLHERNYVAVTADEENVNVGEIPMTTENGSDEIITPEFEGKGMVVFPTDPEVDNAVAVNRIKNSFSDEVDVVFDDPESGIITPVFKESTGDDYLFVLVPLKE